MPHVGKAYPRAPCRDFGKDYIVSYGYPGVAQRGGFAGFTGTLGFGWNVLDWNSLPISIRYDLGYVEYRFAAPPGANVDTSVRARWHLSHLDNFGYWRVGFYLGEVLQMEASYDPADPLSVSQSWSWAFPTTHYVSTSIVDITLAASGVPMLWPVATSLGYVPSGLRFRP